MMTQPISSLEKPSHAASRLEYLVVIFWIGFSALIYQMYSVRVLFLFFVENTNAVAMAIAAFLGGLAFSSLLFSRLTYHNTRNRRLVCLMSMAASLYGYTILTHYQWISEWSDALQHMALQAWLASLLRYAIMVLYLFFPAFFLGGAFPLINGLYLNSLKDSARDTGMVYFWDTLGAITGALLAGFFLLPDLGLRPTIMVAAAINALVALHLVACRRLALFLTFLFLCVIALELYRYVGQPELEFRVTETGRSIPVAASSTVLNERYGRVLFQKESPYGRITVGDISHDRKMLFVNYRGMCGTENTLETTLADGAMAGRRHDSRVLNIGLGCGIMASQLAFHKNTGQLDVVEINPVIPEAATWFAQENKGVLGLPHMHLHVMDGAQWLRTQSHPYDVILIDVEEVSVIYSSPLYTREYFDIIRQRLNPNGVFALWSFSVNPEFTRVMRNTLKSVFPYVELRPASYGNAPYDSVHYFASMQPLHLPKANNSAEAKAFLASVDNSSLTDINMLDNRALEKHYSSTANFYLPRNYRENFVRE